MRLAVTLVALAACQPSLADAPPAKRFEHDMMVRFHMHESYDLFHAIERLVVRNKLDDARALARSIGLAPDDPGMEPWAKQSAVVRERAIALANAQSFDDASGGIARLADACARCHLDAGAAPEFRTTPPLPPDRPTVDARMARHVWAVERLREGVVGGVDEPWRAGLDVLAATPLPWPATDGDRASLARRLHEIADQARVRSSTDELADRSRAYGEILVTCAACHTGSAHTAK
jgi:cytochrome c553